MKKITVTKCTCAIVNITQILYDHPANYTVFLADGTNDMTKIYLIIVIFKWQFSNKKVGNNISMENSIMQQAYVIALVQRTDQMYQEL